MNYSKKTSSQILSKLLTKDIDYRIHGTIRTVAYQLDPDQEKGMIGRSSQRTMNDNNGNTNDDYNQDNKFNNNYNKYYNKNHKPGNTTK